MKKPNICHKKHVFGTILKRLFLVKNTRQWKPHRQPESHAPPRAALLLRTVTHAPARDGAWLTFRPLPTPLQARPAPSRPSSPPAVLPEPCISIFSLFLAFLPFRPPPTGLPLHPRGLGAASLPLQARHDLFFSIDCTSHSRGFTVFLSPPKSEPILGLSSIQIREYDHQKSDLYVCSLWISSDYLREIGWQ